MKLTEHLLTGDGDFRSEECVKLLDEADVVVTNPPFSLFREYVAQLVEHGKKFLIIGQINNCTYKEIFPLIKANKMWLGVTGYMTDMVFGVPEGAEVKQYDREKAAKMGYVGNYTRLGNTCWYTNLDHKRRHDNLVCVEKYDPAKYPKFDNYDAINVDKISNIPKDYDGVMGVPISFLDKYNPEQFEIVQFRKGEDGKDLAFTVERERERCRTSGCSYEEFERKFPLRWQVSGNERATVNGKLKYSRLFFRRRKPSGENKADRGVLLVYEGDKNGNKAVDDEEVQVTELEGDGDFRSEECVKLLDEADVVVTNPPFSLASEYMQQLIEHGKKFLIIGPLNLIKYKDTFPYFMKGLAWPGVNWVKSFTEPGGETMKMGNVVWYTNLDHKKRHEKIVCIEKYDPAKYPKYDNYDAVEVGKYTDIPKDYAGVMGVPISYLMHHNPEQFEIVGTTENGLCDKALWIHPEEKHNEPFIDGKKKYTRILIKKKPSGEDGKDLAFTVERERVVPYFRVLIRRVREEV